MPNRTHGRAPERSLQQPQAAASSIEPVRAAASLSALDTSGTLSSSPVNGNSRLGAA
ncbi:hypothetical protein AB0393_28495 [Streptomyces cyaneofuscatus]|uniref:hypothetical protein n=1 Tax=Streptomyces cyaneofuscatus TaxID=66883 RepID=UPI00344D60ED